MSRTALLTTLLLFSLLGGLNAAPTATETNEVKDKDVKNVTMENDVKRTDNETFTELENKTPPSKLVKPFIPDEEFKKDSKDFTTTEATEQEISTPEPEPVAAEQVKKIEDSSSATPESPVEVNKPDVPDPVKPEEDEEISDIVDEEVIKGDTHEKFINPKPSLDPERGNAETVMIDWPEKGVQVVNIPQDVKIPQQTQISQNVKLPQDVKNTAESAHSESQNNELVTAGDGVRLTSLKVQGLVRHRYATVQVEGEMVNKGDAPNVAHFVIHLPDSAFVTRASLDVDGQRMDGEVRERKAAQAEYQQAVQAGQSAGQVSTSNVRDASHVKVSVNVAPRAKATFNLTYEELLVRRKGRYELAVNLSPGQPAEYMSVLIDIRESSNLTYVQVPPFDSVLGPDGKDDARENTAVNVTMFPNDLGKAQIKFEARASSGGVEGVTLPGPLLVRYDVEHGSKEGEVLLLDGYFVHFLAVPGPSRDQQVLPKHAVFVLDSSGSMWGRKLRQLKDAMGQILGQLRRQDVFSIVTFSTSAAEWTIQEGFDTSSPRRGVYSATRRNVGMAQDFINRMEASGATNIQSALRRALALIARYRNVTLATGVSEGSNYTTPAPVGVEGTQPVLVFLTDGMPTAGELRLNRILSSVNHSNQAAKASVFALAFGEGANRLFLRKLSLQNHGFSRRIYEGADAALQLQSFYQEVASPLLTNLTFTYVDSKVNLSTVTARQFPTFFAGSEAVVAGSLLSSADPQEMLETIEEDDKSQKQGWDSLPAPFFGVMGTVTGQTGVNQEALAASISLPRPLKGNKNKNKDKDKIKQSDKKKKMGHLERAWAYLSIRQYLEVAGLQETNMDEVVINAPTPLPPTVSSQDTPRAKALALALKYGFVTPLSSLVLVAKNPPDGKPREAAVQIASDLDEPLTPEGLTVQDKVIPAGGPMLPSRLPGLLGGPLGPSAPLFPALEAEVSNAAPVNVSQVVADAWLTGLMWLSPKLDGDYKLKVPLPNGETITRAVLLQTEKNADPNTECNWGVEKADAGKCKHLVNCSGALHWDNFETFVERFCDIEGKYAGVCCASI